MSFTKNYIFNYLESKKEILNILKLSLSEALKLTSNNLIMYLLYHEIDEQDYDDKIKLLDYERKQDYYDIKANVYSHNRINALSNLIINDLLIKFKDNLFISNNGDRCEKSIIYLDNYFSLSEIHENIDIITSNFTVNLNNVTCEHCIKKIKEKVILGNIKFIHLLPNSLIELYLKLSEEVLICEFRNIKFRESLNNLNYLAIETLLFINQNFGSRILSSVLDSTCFKTFPVLLDIFFEDAVRLFEVLNLDEVDLSLDQIQYYIDNKSINHLSYLNIKGNQLDNLKFKPQEVYYDTYMTFIKANKLELFFNSGLYCLDLYRCKNYYRRTKLELKKKHIENILEDKYSLNTNYKIKKVIKLVEKSKFSFDDFEYYYWNVGLVLELGSYQWIDNYKKAVHAIKYISINRNVESIDSNYYSILNLISNFISFEETQKLSFGLVSKEDYPEISFCFTKLKSARF